MAGGARLGRRACDGEVLLVTFATGKLRRLGAVLACIGMIGLAPAAAQAQESGPAEAGWGVLSAFSSLVYAPVKVLYAVGGFIVGGLGFVLSAGDKDTMHAILTPSIRGDYVVTPAHLRGEEELEFIGRDPAYR
jgi:hypothetical protein